MKNPGGGTDVEQPELSYTAGRKTMENYLPFPAKYETYTQQIKYQLLGIHPREKNLYGSTKMHAQMEMATYQ